MDPRIIEEIHRLVEDGVRNVQEMQRHIKSFVENNLFKNKPVPSSLNRQFFPRKVDIRNYMYKASVKMRFSKLDQENVEELVKHWQQESPSTSFYLQLYELQHDVMGNKEALFQCQNLDDDKQQHDMDADEDAELDDIKPVTTNAVKNFMFVCQTEWQKRLLNRYGNHLCLLDATYRTTKYSLPLFFLAVKTNVNYMVVASFITQDEKTDSIRDALNILKTWNPEWKPTCFMTDYCNEEINALESIFTGT